MAKKKKKEFENFEIAKEGDPTVLEKEKDKTRAKDFPGSVGRIDSEWAGKVLAIFRDYKSNKQTLESRVKQDQDWFMGRYALAQDVNAGDVMPNSKSAWAFNSIINKHADAMDNIPRANVLAREDSDINAAKILSKVIPCILDARDFEDIYDKVWYDKLIGGGGIYKVFWNNELENGLGDIDIRQISVFNLFWEKDIDNLQESAYLFHVDKVDNKTILEQYPFMNGKLRGSYEIGELKEYNDENDRKDNDSQSLVYDVYYKVKIGTRTVVHLAKLCASEVLWASENLPEYENGYYEHGMYPFVIDDMFPMKNSPFGFGYIDIMKSPQYDIDKLDEAIVKNAMISSKKRWFIRNDCEVDANEYADMSLDFVHFTGNQLDENIKEIEVSPLPQFVTNTWQLKIDELKETSGNRDFSQGSTSAGVTSGSAIAALQEAGSKVSRDIIKSSYRAYKQIVTLVVELIRQFYTEERYFRIDAPNGSLEYIKFSNADMKDVETTKSIEGEVQMRRPAFDFKISAEKQSPFTRTAQNELAKELFAMGVFNPQMADQVMPLLDMMDFEGIDQVKNKVSENQTMFKKLEALTSLAIGFAQVIDATTGVGNAQAQVMQVLGMDGAQGQSPMPNASGFNARPIDSSGMPTTDNTLATQSRLAAAERNTPK